MSEKIYDIIVVGSGIGGLCAGVEASKEGRSALLLEAMTFYGGYINPFKRKGFSFDTGLHYLGELGEGGDFKELFENLGVWNDLDFIELNPKGFNHYFIGDIELKLPKGAEKYKKILCEVFKGEEADIEKFFKGVHKTKNAVNAASYMDQGFLGVLKALKHIPLLMKLSKSTFEEAFLKDIKNDKLKSFFSLMSGEAGLPPKYASAFTVLVLDHYFGGAFYPKGGSGALRDTLVEAIKKNGGELKNRSKVMNITKEGDNFIVATEKEEFKCRAIICNADPAIVFTKLLDDSITPPKLKKKARETKPSMGGFYAFIGTSLDLPSLGITDANICHFDSFYSDSDFTREFNGEFDEFMITCPSIKDPQGGHAPEGKHTIEIISLVDRKPFAKWANMPSMKRGEEYENYKKEIGMRLIKKAEKYIPNLSENLDFVEFATPLSNEYWVNAPGGGCYGPDQTPEQMGMNRFAISSPVKGLFLCGAGTLGGGVSPSAMSGYFAARKAIAYLK